MAATDGTSRPRLRTTMMRTACIGALAAWAQVCAAAEAVEEAPAPPQTPGVVPAPRPEGVPSLQMSTDYGNPALGFGTYAPIGQVESRGVRVEPFTIRAGIQAGIGYNDNVALASTNKTGALFATVSPSVAVGLEGSLARYYLVYRGNYGTYATNAQDDYADHEVTLSAANSWTTRFRTLATYDYVHAHTPRGASVVLPTRTQRWDQHTLSARGSYGSVGAIGGIDGDMAYTTRRYQSQDVGAVAEYDRFDVGGTFSYRVAPKTRTYVRVTYSDISHPRDSTLDSTENTYRVGVAWDALATLTARGAVGYMVKDFSSASRADFSGLGFDAAGTWTPRPQTAVELTATRALGETFEPGVNFLVNTFGTVTWNELWPRSIRSTLSYTYGRVSREGIGSQDTYIAAGGRVSYPIARSFRIGAEYRYDSRNSEIPGADYTRNIFLITAETAL